MGQNSTAAPPEESARADEGARAECAGDPTFPRARAKGRPKVYSSDGNQEHVGPVGPGSC